MSTTPPNREGELFPEIYGELRRVAGRYLQRERRNHTLQPTALVHEAWLRMQKERSIPQHARTQGLALGALAMRRLLVDHGRHQKREKRGGGIQPIVLDTLFDAAATGASPHPEEGARAPVSKDEAERGMAAMSEKFRAMGEQAYVDAEKVKESNRAL